jgi:hypothetical protein
MSSNDQIILDQILWVAPVGTRASLDGEQLTPPPAPRSVGVGACWLARHKIAISNRKLK